MSGLSSIKDMFDGGGAGGSGSEYSFKSHDEYKNDYKDKHGKDDPNAQSHSGGPGGNNNSGYCPVYRVGRVGVTAIRF